MITSTVTIDDKNLSNAISQFPHLMNTAVREQAQATKADIQQNIRKYDAIDTGTMLGSVAEHMLGQYDAEVTVNAESADGAPYPVYVNYGTIHVAARPFFTEAVTKVIKDFPARVKRYYLGLG